MVTGNLISIFLNAPHMIGGWLIREGSSQGRAGGGITGLGLLLVFKVLIKHCALPEQWLRDWAGARGCLVEPQL